MKSRIECNDGVYRTEKEYCVWIRNLAELYELEPGDLTDDEMDALREAGCIDD